VNPFLTEIHPNLSSQTLPNFNVGLRLTFRITVIRVYDNSGNVIETHEQTDEFKKP